MLLFILSSFNSRHVQKLFAFTILSFVFPQYKFIYTFYQPYIRRYTRLHLLIWHWFCVFFLKYWMSVPPSTENCYKLCKYRVIPLLGDKSPSSNNFTSQIRQGLHHHDDFYHQVLIFTFMHQGKNHVKIKTRWYFSLSRYNEHIHQE